jgi:hypothetical protein
MHDMHYGPDEHDAGVTLVWRRRYPGPSGWYVMLWLRCKSFIRIPYFVLVLIYFAFVLNQAYGVWFTRI